MDEVSDSTSFFFFFCSHHAQTPHRSAPCCHNFIRQSISVKSTFVAVISNTDYSTRFEPNTSIDVLIFPGGRLLNELPEWYEQCLSGTGAGLCF